MKVLMANKYYYHKGGVETHSFALKKMLEGEGHQIVDFSMKDEKNYQTPYSKYFIENIDYEKPSGLFTKLDYSLKIIYSLEAKRKIEELISAEKPDIAHLHNIYHHMSFSIVHSLKKNKIPIIYTAHDLKLICANYKMLNHGKICEKCKGDRHYNCFFSNCIKGSRSKSFINMMEMYVHKLLKINELIDIIIAPSKFYRDKMIEFGIRPDKVIYIPNFIESNKIEPCYENQNYFLFVGRLSEEKGLLTLVRAMKKVEGCPLYIVGTGPMEGEVKKAIHDFGVSDKIKMLGFKSGEELMNLERNSMFSVIPSEWYENSPYAVLEFMCYGKPTIGSNVAGIPEFVEDGKTGLLFEMGNAEQLGDRINQLIANKDLIIQYGKNAREKVENLNNPIIYLEQLMDIYKSLLSN